LLAIIFSGMAALGYELLWTKLLSLVLGGEVLGILGVLAGFFGGMVIGAVCLSRHATKSQNPLKVFLILELVTAIYGILSPHLIYWLSNWLPAVLGPTAGDNQSLIALLLTLVIAGLALLPATFCIGANFAYLVEARRRQSGKEKKGVGLGRVYAANTFGATLGVWGAVYLVMPMLGLAWSGVFFALIGLLAIVFAWYWGKQTNALADSNTITRESKVAKSPKYAIPVNWIYVLLFGTGISAIGLEIAVIHFLKQILQNTVYTFANILAIYLLGTAIGAWLFQRFIKRWKQLPTLLFSAMTISIVCLLLLLSQADHFLIAFSPSGTHYVGHLIAEILLVLVIFLIPTIVMGGLFSYLLSGIPSTMIGRAYGINTLGATLAPFLFGLVLIPLGSLPVFLTIFASYLSFEIIFYLQTKQKLTRLLPSLAVGLLLLLFLRYPLDLIQISPGWNELERKEGLMGTVIVSEEPIREGPFNLPKRTIQVNNHFRMGGGVSFIERRMGNLPLLLADNPKKVLFLGLGTGSTLGTIKDHPVDEVTGVEIVPEILELLPWFKEHQQQVLKDPRLTLHTADARRFVKANAESYDLIIADLFHPARDGAGLLFTVEHFQGLQSRLNEKGILAQWIPLHQFDQENLKTVIRSFLTIFPNTHAFVGGYNAEQPILALVALPENQTVNLDRAHQLISSRAGIQSAIENTNDLLASYMADANALKRFIGEGPLNRDLNPVVLFRAPRSIYIPETSRAQSNIESLFAYRTIYPEDLFNITTPTSRKLLQSGKTTWTAAGHYQQANLEQIKGNTFAAWNKYVESYTTDPDFSPARGKLFRAVMQKQVEAKTIQPFLRPDHWSRLQNILSRYGQSN